MWATSAEVKLSRSSPGVEVSVVLEGLIEADVKVIGEIRQRQIPVLFTQHLNSMLVCLFVQNWGYILGLYIYIYSKTLSIYT